MGLGPLNAIYQARFNRYLHNRGIKDTSDQHVWAFLGDGEMDEVESLGAIGLAAREELDNLTFVINCNLQRLDGPVRGNGKIIQELEAFFRGAGWNVIKVIWGREWDPLLAADTDGALVNLMNVTPDGDYQTYKAESGAYVREHFFGRDPRTRKMVEHMSDDEIWNLKRGGHDYRKLYAAYKAAHRAHRPADGDPRQDDQGLDARVALRGPQRHPPDEEADPGRPQDASGTGSTWTSPTRRWRRTRTCRRTTTRARTPTRCSTCSERRARRWAATVPSRRTTTIPLAMPGDRGVRRRQARLRQAEGRHHDGVRPAAQGPDEGQGDRRALGADHPGRGPHVRHGLAVPDREDLLAARAELHAGRPRAVPVLQGGHERADPARGHQRGRLGRDRSPRPARRTPPTASR